MAFYMILDDKVGVSVDMRCTCAFFVGGYLLLAIPFNHCMIRIMVKIFYIDVKYS